MKLPLKVQRGVYVIFSEDMNNHGALYSCKFFYCMLAKSYI